MTELDQKTFVLVPGAWLGAWSWYPVAAELAARGADVVALTLSGLSYGSSPRGLRLSDAVDYIVDEVERRDLSGVVLACHSWGGYPATGAAHRLAKRIAKVVYYNAVVPSSGRSMADENDEYGAAIRQSMAERPDQTVPVPFEAVQYGLMQDEPENLQRLVYQMLLPQPGGYMIDALDLPPVTEAGLAAAYVLGVDDKSLARPGSEFAGRLGVDPVMVEGSHMAMLSKPAVVAQALLAAAA